MIVFSIIVSYLIGSIPTGYWISRLKGIDVRQHGSGNLGATNVFRVLGKPAGIVTLVVDALKGVICVTWIAYLFANSHINLDWLRVLNGFAAIIGHNWTIFLKFKGGKGVATSAGIIIGLEPYAFLICLIIFLILVSLTRIVSIGSLSTALALPIIFIWKHEPLPQLIFALVASILVIYRHKENIKRIWLGKEFKIGQKS